MGLPKGPDSLLSGRQPSSSRLGHGGPGLASPSSPHSLCVHMGGTVHGWGAEHPGEGYRHLRHQMWIAALPLTTTVTLEFLNLLSVSPLGK